jgi:outer membrane immunogenic protein
MRTVLFAGASVVALMSSASAQTFDWSGTYIGVQGGYVMSAPLVGGSSSSGEDSLDEQGYLAGVYFGRDWQNNGLVYGLVGDVDFIMADEAEYVGKGEDYRYDVDWLASGRGRMGSPFTDHVLVTGSFGVAAAGVNGVLEGADQSDEVLFGGVLGIGVDVAVDDHWTFKADYSHYQFGDFELENGDGNLTIKPKFGVVKVGVAYRF